MPTAIPTGKIESTDDAIRFIHAGRATFTIANTTTGARYTLRARKDQRKDVWYVDALTGPSNESDYRFLGVIIGDEGYRHATKSAIAADAPIAVAARWFLDRLVAGALDLAKCSKLELWHEGRCGRCGRKLTVPESIATGLGPECASKAAA